MILMVLKVGPFAEGSAKEKERVLHTSANGIETMDNGYMRKDLSASELTVLMGNGINLGNTMEAYGRISLGTEAPVSSYETFWSQPVTTQEMITGMKTPVLTPFVFLLHGQMPWITKAEITPSARIT